MVAPVDITKKTSPVQLNNMKSNETQVTLINKKSKDKSHITVNVSKVDGKSTKKRSAYHHLFPKPDDVPAVILSTFYLRTVLLFMVMLGVFFMSILVIVPTLSNSNPQVIVIEGKPQSPIWPDPPPHENLAEVARYVMHISEWGSLATNSTHEGIEGYPFVNVFSVSDGPIRNSTGVPYFYLTAMELSVKDLKVNSKASLTLSEAQSDYCNEKGFDPEDPRCAHIILTGSMVKLENGSEEEHFARLALFSRHEEMPDWPTDHDWFFAKLDIVHIYVLDYFGGVGIVDINDYYASNPFKK